MLPQGLSSEASTRIANLIANRTCALVHIAICLGQVPGIEQPKHKRGLIALPRWQELILQHPLFDATCKQGCYGSDTEKPTSIFSTHKRWRELANRLSAADRERILERDKKLVARKRDNMGNLRITGLRDSLRSTQAYTQEFGRAIAAGYEAGCVPGVIAVKVQGPWDFNSRKHMRYSYT